jgi:hypothetical protein
MGFIYDRQRALGRQAPARAVQRKAANVLPDLRGAPAGGDGAALPAQLQSGIEALSGLSMDHVRVHYNSPRAAQMQAQAYAQGSDIHLGPGHEQHLPHEAWHVVQQAQGRVAPTMQTAGGIGVNDDTGLEREADVMGARALHTMGAAPSGTLSSRHGGAGTVQAKGGNPGAQEPDRFRKRKQKYVDDVIKKNLAKGTPGWFALRPEQLATYTDRVFALLERIRISDMTTLALAHQQVNDEAKATPDDKARTLRKHIAYSDEQIAGMRGVDAGIAQDELRRLEQALQVELAGAASPGWKKKRPTGKVERERQHAAVVKRLRARQALQQQVAQARATVAKLERMRRQGDPDIGKLDKLKQYRARMQRELRMQQALSGKEGMNIDFLNTSEADDAGQETVRAYMAIMAPNYDNTFKDFYLNDHSRLTYSANDKILWISFGTPLRSLSWFQKYALGVLKETKPANNVPLIRSFALPMAYFTRHMEKLGTERQKSGKVLATRQVDVDLEKAYGTDLFGASYRSHVQTVDPHLMNVDIKYPNQFALERHVNAAEADAPPGFFARTEQQRKHRQAEVESQRYDEQLEDAKRQGTDAASQSLPGTEQWDAVASRLLDQHMPKLKQDPAMSLNRPRGDAQLYLRAVAAGDPAKYMKGDDGREAALGYLMELAAATRQERQEAWRKEIGRKQREGQEAVKALGTGDSRVRGHVAKVVEDMEQQVRQARHGDMHGEAMSDLLRYALPGTFTTIALAHDRRFDHVAAKEGPLHDVGDFVSGLGLVPRGATPEFHFLDDKNTALHHIDKDGKWPSATPEQTEAIYHKMRFFFHVLDRETSAANSAEAAADLDFSAPDLTRDSHMEKVVELIGTDPKASPAIEALAAVFHATDVESHLSELLNRNHFTPSDVFGLPRNLASGRTDRQGNVMVKTAAETYFAKKQLTSEASLDFIAAQAQTLIDHLRDRNEGASRMANVLEVDYIQRDLQEILGIRQRSGIGIVQAVPIGGQTLLRALETMKEIKQVDDKHGQLRLVYLFFHILRPLAQEQGKKKGALPEPGPDQDPVLAAENKGALKVNNRVGNIDYFNFLNPRGKPFGLLGRRSVPEPSMMMPYDINRSTTQYGPSPGASMTNYMAAKQLPFAGGVSGTTRDQSQVLAHFFSPETLKDHYWRFQLTNAAFMIANGYHSFFEAIYVAARFDPSEVGKKVLEEFARLRDGTARQHQIYLDILKAIDAGSDIMQGFETWYGAQVHDGEQASLDQPPGLSPVDTAPSSQVLPDSTQAVATSQETAGSSAKADDINQDYLYEDTDIYTLLHLRAAQQGLQNVSILPPVDNIVGSQLSQRLREEQAHGINNARTILIPYNLGNYHWIGIVLVVAANQAGVTAYVMDPMKGRGGKPLEEASSIVTEIRAVYDNAAIAAAGHLLQQDGTSCGVLTVENLIRIASTPALAHADDKEVKAGARALRYKHARLMERERPDQRFAHKQKYGQYSFSSFDVKAYLAKNAQLTVAETWQVVEIVKLFGTYPEKNALMAAFGKLAAGTTLEVALPDIRAGLNTVLHRLRHGGAGKEQFLAAADAMFELPGGALDLPATFEGVRIRNAGVIENVGMFAGKDGSETAALSLQATLARDKEKHEAEMANLQKAFSAKK